MISQLHELAEPRRENLYAQLREEILSCTLAPGQNLHEGTLAARFAVSKSPVRDALMRLEAEGLVTVQARRGYTVAPVSLADAADLFELRAFMEAETVHQAAISATDAALRDLEGFRSLAAWGADRFIAYNRDFHLTIAQLCPNRRIRAAARDVIEQFDRLVILDMIISKTADPGTMIAEHNTIIDAVQARDGRRARRLMTQHVEKFRRRAMTTLARSPIVP